MKSLRCTTGTVSLVLFARLLRSYSILVGVVVATFPPHAIGYTPPNSVPRPTDVPKEECLPGDQYLKTLNRYSQITPGGDLAVNIPLLTVPGQIPVPLNLTYQSGITLDEAASWVGLGWNLANWSVRRITIHGDDGATRREYVRDTNGLPMDSLDLPDFPNTRYFVNDAFQVSVPGRNVQFINVGTPKTPHFVPAAFSRDSLAVIKSARLYRHPFDFYEFYEFMMIDEDGLRYVFRMPLQRYMLRDPRVQYMYPDVVYEDTTMMRNAEWLLTAILSHDYVDTIGDTLDPLDSPNPRYDNGGSWVSFVYCDADKREFAKTLRQYYAYESLYNSPQLPQPSDKIEIAFLRKIITPSCVVQFNLTQLRKYKTMRYMRTAPDVQEQFRKKDLVLAQIKTFEYSGDSTLPTGPELSGVSFSYEPDQLHVSTNDTIEAKRSIHQTARGHPQQLMDGEPTLRSVIFGANMSYSVMSATWEDNSGWPGRRMFSFEYDPGPDITWYAVLGDGLDDSMYYNHVHLYWQNGVFPGSYGLLSQLPTSDRLEILHSRDRLAQNGFIDNWFGGFWKGRDYFGFQWNCPWIWSLSKLTTPEGLTIGVEYESDRFRFDSAATVTQGGGCRVKRLIFNADASALYPESADRQEPDTIVVSYSDSGHQDAGVPLAMPANYWTFTTLNLGDLASDSKWSSQFEHFQGDNASHDIVYPVIRQDFSAGRGSITRTYTVPSYPIAQTVSQPNTLGGHKKVTMKLGPFELFDWNLFFSVYYSVWFDRSPLFGVETSETYRSAQGQIVQQTERRYSFHPMAAMLAIDDFWWDITDPSDGFEVGDTLGASYFVQLDEVIHRRDGVEKTEVLTYDSLKRLESHRIRAHERDLVTKYTYASTVYPEMRARHYLGQVARIDTCEQHISYPPQVRGQTVYEYRSDFASQSRSGTSQIFYQSNTRRWHDLDQNGLVGELEYVDTTILDVDRRGMPTMIADSRGTSSGFVRACNGNETVFRACGGSGFAAFTSETETADPTNPWRLGSGSALDSSVALSGRKSVRMIGQVTTSYGPTAQLAVSSSGWYVAEAWVRSGQANAGRLAMARRLNGLVQQASTNHTQVGSWQRLVCSLYVSPPESLRVYTATSTHDAWTDDVRVYRSGSLMTSTILDPLGRVIAESDENNLPRLTFHDDNDQVLAQTDFHKSPKSGNEFFWANGGSGVGTWYDLGLNGIGRPYRYGKYASIRPNQVYGLHGSKRGIVESFSTNPLSEWIIQSRGTSRLVWDSANQRLALSAQCSGISYHDIVIPVDSFRSGLLGIDLWRPPHTTAPCSPTDSITTTLGYSILVLGFEDETGSGVAFRVFGVDSLIVFNYSNGNLELPITIATGHDVSLYLGALSRRTRLMFGKFGDNAFIFGNGNCVFHVPVADNRVFSKLRLRFQDWPGRYWQELWLDNLVFHNEPRVACTFLDVSGSPKQIQSFDGTNITVAGSDYDSFGRQLVAYKPIEITSTPSYDTAAAGGWQYYSTIITDPRHRSPFDFMEAYRHQNHFFYGEPGDPVSDSSELYRYYTSETGAPDCHTASGLRPFSYIEYAPDPLLRPHLQYPEGRFSDHPVVIDYSANAAPLGLLDPLIHGPDSLYAERRGDENGKITVTYRNKLGYVVAISEDSGSSEDPINATTYFFQDFAGRDTLIIQPEGQRLIKRYNNLGWLLQEQSPDIGTIRRLYDQVGNLRFEMSSDDAIHNRFRYFKYDDHDRIIEEGVYEDTLSGFGLPAAWNQYFPDADLDTRAKITARYVYDRGSYGLGRLFRVTRYPYPDGFPDSGSWQQFTYDEFGRIIRVEQHVDPVDGSSSRVIQATYNQASDLTQLTYPNGRTVNYRYGLDGRLNSVIDGDSTMRVAFEYWPDGTIKREIIGPNPAAPLQVVDYRYNARGWLESINEGQLDGGDLFAERIGYDSGAALFGAFDEDGNPVTVPRGYYNGNVAFLQTKLADSPDSILMRFGYDGLDRLWGAQYSSSTPRSPEYFNYDRNGNLNAVMGGLHGPIVNDYHRYPGTNRVREVTGYLAGTNAITYDSSGGVVSLAPWGMSIGYNERSEMAWRTRPGEHPSLPNRVEYRYNDNGDRILKRYHYWVRYNCPGPGPDPDPDWLMGAAASSPDDSGLSTEGLTFGEGLDGGEISQSSSGGGGGGSNYCYRDEWATTGYYYFNSQLLSTYSGPNAGDLQRNYVYANGKRIAWLGKNVGEAAYYLGDHLGSVGVVVASDGSVIDKYRYGPWGDDRGSMVTFANAFTYTGKEQDEELGVDWLYYGARYYDPNLRLFTQPDPLYDRTPDFGSYVYCADNPLKYVDPNGESVSLGPAFDQQWKENHPVAAFLMDPSFAIPSPAAIEGPAMGAGKSLLGRAIEKVGSWLRGSTATTEVATDLAGAAARYFESFDALKKGMGAAGEGMQWHHIVEQSQIGRFGSHAIHNTENVLAVPTAVNQKIAGFYSSIQRSYTGTSNMTVREWLSTRTYDEALDFGRMILEQFNDEILK